MTREVKQKGHCREWLTHIVLSLSPVQPLGTCLELQQRLGLETEKRSLNLIKDSRHNVETGLLSPGTPHPILHKLRQRPSEAQLLAERRGGRGQWQDRAARVFPARGCGWGAPWQGGQSRPTRGKFVLVLMRTFQLPEPQKWPRGEC